MSNITCIKIIHSYALNWNKIGHWNDEEEQLQLGALAVQNILLKEPTYWPPPQRG